MDEAWDDWDDDDVQNNGNPIDIVNIEDLNAPFDLRDYGNGRFNHLRLNAEVVVIEDEERRESDSEVDTSTSSDVYIVNNHAFQWDVVPELKKKKDYRTDILFNSSNTSVGGQSRENVNQKHSLLKALEKTFGRKLPLSQEWAPAISLKREFSKSSNDYCLSLQLNLENEFFLKLRDVVLNPILTVEVKIGNLNAGIEIPLDLLDDVDVTGPYHLSRDFARLANKKLQRCESVKGTISVKLRGEENMLSGTYQGFSLGEKLFNPLTDTDCTLVAAHGKEFQCHQLILKTYSTVFRTMFDSGMQEATMQRVEMEGISQEEMKAFLKFLYTRDLTVPTRNLSVALSLLRIAHKYEIKELEHAMFQLFKAKRVPGDQKKWYATTSVEEVLELYVFAHQVESNYEILKKACAQVLKSRVDEVKEAELFGEMFRTQPEVAMQLTLAFAK